LLEQGFIKNPDQTIRELVSAKIAELGENIVIRRFTRYLVGEALATMPLSRQHLKPQHKSPVSRVGSKSIPRP